MSAPITDAHRARAREWLDNLGVLLERYMEKGVVDAAATLIAETREACARKVEAERAKLNGRWSLDSAYLSQAIAAIRAGAAEVKE